MPELNPYASPKFEAGDPLVAAGYKPPTVLGAIGRGTTLYVQCFPTVALITLTVWLPLEIAISYLEYFVLDPDNVMAAIRLSMLADWFIGIIAAGGVISVGAAALRGERRSWLQGLGDGLMAWPRMFGTRFLSMLFVTLGLLLFVLPGLYLAIRFSLSEPVAVIERHGGMYALSRSQQLTRGNFWQFLVLAALMVGMLLVVGIVVFLPLEFVPAMNHWLVSAALSCLIDLTTAWFMLIYVAAYVATIDAERRQRQIAAEAAAAKTALLPPFQMFPSSDFPTTPERPNPTPFL